MSDWPQHPDGRNKKIGEMTRDEQDAVTRAACQRLKREFEHPLVQQKISALLRGENVKQ